MKKSKKKSKLDDFLDVLDALADLLKTIVSAFRDPPRSVEEGKEGEARSTESE